MVCTGRFEFWKERHKGELDGHKIKARIARMDQQLLQYYSDRFLLLGAMLLVQGSAPHFLAPRAPDYCFFDAIPPASPQPTRHTESGGVINNCAAEDFSTEARPERKRSRM